MNFPGAKKFIVNFFSKEKKTGKAENPYLAARRTWNAYVGSIISSRQTWQIVGLLSLLIALASVGGIIHIGSQSKFVPYLVEVDKLSGQVLAIGPIQATAKTDARIIHATVAEWVSDMRMVSPDSALQTRALLRSYAKLAPDDSATQKANEWFGSTPEANPLRRASKEMVSVDIKSVLPLSADTWQVDWIETVRDRSGVKKSLPFTMRALVTVYVAGSSSRITEEQLRLNPMNIYVRDFSWSRLSHEVSQ